jgi:hypothetical protein
MITDNTYHGVGPPVNYRHENHSRPKHKPMSTSPQESPSDSSTNAPALTERIVAFERDDGAVVVYDEREHTAWLQSTGAVPLTDAR